MTMNTLTFEHLLVPIANEEDARKTAQALQEYDPSQITMVFVVEKAGGGVDPVGPERAKSLAREAFDAFQEYFPEATEELGFGTDVADTIFSVAEETEADAIAFTSRGGGRLLQFLTGDTTRRLVTENGLPVISLPAPTTSGES